MSSKNGARQVQAAVLLSCLISGTLPAADVQRPDKPNILFILTEDQGAHLGVLGTAGLQTPPMDALARSGVLFRNAFVAYPVCSASKACIYTGLHNHRNGILNNTVWACACRSPSPARASALPRPRHWPANST